ncbi:MAG: restriction endonuclease subunit S [Rhodocyclaceae bacterium]|nr:restriction endonuclease subunit S [Rhodocyclaceae bacterium]
MSHYKPYPAYRDSGVEWIGQVPEHWRVSAVKREFNTQLGKMLQPEQKNPLDIPVPYHKAVSVQWERVADIPPEIMWASPVELEQYRVRKGDLLICEGGDVGRAAIFEGEDFEPVIIQNSIHRIRAKNGNDNELLLRVMQTVKRSGWFDVLCSKATIVHFTSEKLGDLAFPVAPLDERKAIISTVRHETNRIDALITKKTRFIELLKEKRHALIDHAVIKGLNSDTPLRDSDVEWLGEIPAHWAVRRMASIFREAIRPGDPDLPILSISIHDGITDNEVAPENRERRVSQIEDRTKYKRVAPNDLAYNMMRAWQGAFGAVTVNGLVSPAYVVAEPMIEFRTAYIENLLRTPMAIEEMRRYSRGIADFRMRLYWDYFRDLKVCLPPLEEQDKILEMITRETSRIDLLTEKTQRSIDLLKERRAAFITAAVTGQIDLRESA